MSHREQQVTAQAVKSGVVYVMRFTPDEYNSPDGVSQQLSALAERFDTWMAVDGVEGIASIETINFQNQIQLQTQILVQSSSGRSTTEFVWVYPVADFNTANEFAAEVQRVRGTLDAVEGA